MQKICVHSHWILYSIILHQNAAIPKDQTEAHHLNHHNLPKFPVLQQTPAALKLSNRFPLGLSRDVPWVQDTTSPKLPINPGNVASSPTPFGNKTSVLRTCLQRMIGHEDGM